MSFNYMSFFTENSRATISSTAPDGAKLSTKLVVAVPKSMSDEDFAEAAEKGVDVGVSSINAHNAKKSIKRDSLTGKSASRYAIGTLTGGQSDTLETEDGKRRPKKAAETAAVTA